MKVVVLLLLFWVDAAGTGNNLAVKFDSLTECEEALPKVRKMLAGAAPPAVVYAAACTEMQAMGMGL